MVIEWLAYNRGFRSRDISDWLTSPSVTKAKQSEVLPGVASGPDKGAKAVDSGDPDEGALEEESGIFSEPSHQVKSSVLSKVEPASLQTQICSDLGNDDPSVGVVISNYLTEVDTLKVIGAEINQLGKKMQSSEHALKMFDILTQPNHENEYGAEGNKGIVDVPRLDESTSSESKSLPSVLDKVMARMGNVNPYAGDGEEEEDRLSDETELKTVSGNKSEINQVSLTESNIVSLPNETHGVNLSIVSGLVDDSAKVEFRIDAQSHDADGAQEVFDKRSQQVSAATSRGGRKNLDEKGGGSNMPYAQSKRAAHAPSVFEPNHGLNWARAVTEGSKPKANAPRLNKHFCPKIDGDDDSWACLVSCGFLDFNGRFTQDPPLLMVSGLIFFGSEDSDSPLHEIMALERDGVSIDF
ncbi:hypothetical protein U1Q18_003377 [Sarracenia purpurea var. burkii]